MSVQESAVTRPLVETNTSELKRGLKPRHLQLIALGGIIGSCYFLGTGYIVESTGPAAVLAYLLGGLLVYMVMVCLGELAVHIPISGSFVNYANDFISPTWGCGVGWSYWTTWVTYVPSEMIAAGIIMNNFVPQVDTVYWALFFGLLITVINLTYVGTFGELEFWLALIKIVAIVMFIVMAGLIFLGVIGREGFLGGSKLMSEGGLFPEGVWAVFLTMVMILVNFQGSEIIGLAAGESQNPEKTLPAAIKKVSYRIIALYVIPVMLLVTILPWREAGLEESVFAMALNSYGFEWAGALFSFVVLTAAISCSNSGLYGCSRAIYSLAREGMAPRLLGRVNKKGVPYSAILFSVAGCWVGVIAFTIDKSETLYTYLLALSGFTGAMAWISICWSQLKFRRRLEQNGYDVGKLKFRAPYFPYFTHFAIWAQVACLVLVALNEELRISLYVGLPLLILPMIWFHFWGKNLRADTNLNSRLRFEDIFGAKHPGP